MENLEKVKLIALDLRDGTQFPRSPRATLADYVMAARALDKTRAALVGWQGEYHPNCGLDQIWLEFAGIDFVEFQSFVATGATDEEVAIWISQHARQKTREERIVWSNQQRDKRLSDLSVETQVFMEDYIKQNLPPNSVVYHWFDVYDIEEQRI